MKTPDVLITLQELADEAAEAAAIRLAQAITALEAATEKLHMLQQVRAEYSDKLAARMQAGLSLACIRNYQQFMEKVDLAIDGQQDIAAKVQLRCDAVRDEWQLKKREGQSYATLIKRAAQEAARKENRREQKASDEFAMRASLSRRLAF